MLTRRIGGLMEARGQGALRVNPTPPWPPQPPNGGFKKCCPKSHPTECKTGLQNDSKFDQNHVQRVCREGSAQMYVKRSQFQPSQTLSEGFSCKRAQFLFFRSRSKRSPKRYPKALKMEVPEPHYALRTVSKKASYF